MTPPFFGGTLSPIFLKKYNVSETSSVSVFRQRSTQTGVPLDCAILNRCAPRAQ